MAEPRVPIAIALVAGLAVAAAAPDPVRHALPPPAPRFAPPPEALFADDFSDRSLARWRADRAGVWSVRRGHLRGQLPDERQQRAFLHAGDSTWTDYALDFDVCMLRGVDKGAAVRVSGEQAIGVDLRGPGYQDVVIHRGWIPLGKARAVNGNGTWHHVRIEALGSRYRVYVNGALKLERTDRARARGGIALAAYTGGVGECTLYYDNVVVTALDDAAAAGATSARD